MANTSNHKWSAHRSKPSVQRDDEKADETTDIPVPNELVPLTLVCLSHLDKILKRVAAFADAGFLPDVDTLATPELISAFMNRSVRTVQDKIKAAGIPKHKGSLYSIRDFRDVGK